MASRFSCLFIFSIVLLASFLVEIRGSSEEGDASKEFVLTLDHSNFSEVVSKHDFIVVEFYAPWCGHCKNLAPEYEKAASLLSSHDPAIVLAKVDANEEANKQLATQYEVNGFPTLKIFRNGGKNIQEYKGPRDAEGIANYLKKLTGPASAELKSMEDASNFIGDKKIVVVGVFPKFSGEEFENFIALADKLRSDYEFAHTSDAKHLPRGESSVTGPIVRLFKPFDELYVDIQNFNVDALEKFIEEFSVPLVTIFDKNPENQPYLMKYFNSPIHKVMLYLNFSSDKFEAIKSKFHDVASQYKGKGMGFLMGDIDASQNAFDYFGLKHEQAPLIIIQNNDGQKYLAPNVEHDQIESWMKEYKDGKVQPFKKSEPIPETNDEPVKVVVSDTLQDVFFNSGKNVLLEFYAPWCGHCKQLAPILDEVAVSYESDADVIIAKIDGTKNDVPTDTFTVKGFPTMYFRSSSGKLLEYDGGRTKEDIIGFIQKNRDITAETESVKDEL